MELKKALKRNLDFFYDVIDVSISSDTEEFMNSRGLSIHNDKLSCDLDESETGMSTN